MICAACLPSVDNCELSRPDVILNASRINGNAVMTLRKPVTLSKQKTSFNNNKQMLVLKFWFPTYMYELSVIVSVMFLAPIRFLTEQVSWFSFEPDIPDCQIILKCLDRLPRSLENWILYCRAQVQVQIRSRSGRSEIDLYYITIFLVSTTNFFLAFKGSRQVRWMGWDDSSIVRGG